MFGEKYKQKKVLITGNTGFKGAWLTTWLLNLGAEVYGYSIDIPSTPSLYTILNLESKIKMQYGDVCDKELVEKTITDIKPDYIFHLAAQSVVSVSFDSPRETFLTNTIGTINILDAIVKLENNCSVVFITSDKCYQNNEWSFGYRETDHLGGKDPYSASKAAAEIAIRSYYESFISKMGNIKVASVRAGNVIGGGDWTANRIVPDCFRAWSNKKSVVIRNPLATRPWQHVLEPLSGYLQLAVELTDRPELNGESFNFGPLLKSDYTVKDLIELLWKNWPDKFTSDFLISETPKYLEASLLKLSIDKAIRYLKWHPLLSVSDLAIYTSDWYSAYYRGEDMGIVTSKQIENYSNTASIEKIKWR